MVGCLRQVQGGLVTPLLLACSSWTRIRSVAVKSGIPIGFALACAPGVTHCEIKSHQVNAPVENGRIYIYVPLREHESTICGLQVWPIDSWIFFSRN